MAPGRSCTALNAEFCPYKKALSLIFALQIRESAFVLLTMRLLSQRIRSTPNSEKIIRQPEPPLIIPEKQTVILRFRTVTFANADIFSHGLFSIFLFPFFTLWANKVAFELLSSAAGLLGLSREGKFLSEMSSVTGLMMAVISSSTIFFVVAMAVFASAGAG